MSETIFATKAQNAVLPRPLHPTVATHWGVYRARLSDGVAVALDPYEHDADPSPIGSMLIESRDAPSRIRTPHVRASFLDRGAAAGGEGRGAEPFVPVSWDIALDLAAGEIERIRTTYGNEAIYGGSYGWASAGRFHHAQSQLHRFLNAIGGYVRSVQNYSFAAGDVILPHVIGSSDGLFAGHTSWSEIADEAEIVLMFGGAPLRNAQVNSGGIARHATRAALESIVGSGASIINVSPLRNDVLDAIGAEWIGIHPNTDVALMLAIAHVLIAEDLHDRHFLARYTIGFDRLAAYIGGAADGIAKTPEWATPITGIAAKTICDLARRLGRQKSMISVAWALQRADHGEQPFWMAMALAAMLGGIGLPGRGIGYGYVSSGGIGHPPSPVAWPPLPQGSNTVKAFIPVARIADMLLEPGGTYAYNGSTRRYPHIRLIHWAGGNPFHHHQDLNRLVAAWRRPEAIIVHESFWNAHARHADIVFPAATQIERNDIAAASRDGFIAASHKLFEPAGNARTDYEILSGLARRLGVEAEFTEGRDEAAWVRHLYGEARKRAERAGHCLPDFDTFWPHGIVELPRRAKTAPLLSRFRADPEAYPLPTPSGRIELYSERIASFDYDDCPGHPAWIEPAEWRGAALARFYPLHLLSNQPARKLHSQYDFGAYSQAGKIAGREVLSLNPADAAKRGIATGDVVRVFNARGALLAGALVTDAIVAGAVQMSTGAWYDPMSPGGLDRNGNPNVLTLDKGSSRLAQAPSANSCLVEVELYQEAPPPITCYDPPAIRNPREGS
jgi:biotin/methionine sulfoxide reductase